MLFKTFIKRYLQKCITMAFCFRSWSKEYLGYQKEVVDYITEIVEEHKATFDGDNIRDYIGILYWYRYISS